MHEAGIMESALAVIGREAGAHGATQLARVILRVGAISGVEPEALRFAFEALSPGTVAEGAELVIEQVPARAHCAECDGEFTVEGSWLFECPLCHTLSGDVRSGRELELARLEFFEPTTPNHAYEH
ncbi:MAG TPA: hydrogenase maturation nickel metallochaperone HypA [Opitutaceae bacterium]